MKVAIGIIAIIMGLISAVAALSQVRKQRTNLVMAFGGMIMIIAAILCLLGVSWDWIIVILGAVAICGAAIQNGRANGKIHPLHHVIRLGLCAIIAVGFYIS